ncbi:lipase family protein [Pseudomonas sp. LS1212]|uniref:lipase family protein n=1 Tax=Pseudomonas sp. LS1212 TaxID=2972478 RepID=UPI00215BD615|nr:lipase family protein [Pseudomonas sp. LS1212]UVJ42180.1 lipase family protein [Pseudomonas sp. LS1212]
MTAYKPMEDWEKPFFSDKMLACPLKGHWVSFQLVDEFGDGKPYGGLAYKVQDGVGQVYTGTLDADGFAKIANHYRGPVVLSLNEQYAGSIDSYSWLMTRQTYKLPITELQVRAEQTRFFHKDGFRVEHNPAQKGADEFVQVEVRDLVKHGAHLPPVVERTYLPSQHVLKWMGDLGFGPEQDELWGTALFPNKHTVLEVRPMRALRPMLSTDCRFCALNLYQLALMATMSYNGFGQRPETRPVDTVSFPLDPSFGNLFGEAVASYQEAWRVDPGQSKRFYPLYEDVPYSKRFEILPFDPTLYEQNHRDRGEEQEHPASLHFFDHGRSKTDTQAFISHHDEIILISVRGTGNASLWETVIDGWRDADAEQVPFEEGVGKVHRGFYRGYQAISEFVQRYLDQFHAGQKVIICGHSLGGAIALLLAEALRRSSDNDYDILLYTFGAPRAGDATFVSGASSIVEGAPALVHHRMVNNNDPVPSVPAPWMNVRRRIWVPGLAMITASNPYLGLLVFAIGLTRTGGEPYQHHGEQQHFMPVDFGSREQSSVLWSPGCASIEEAACTRALKLHGDMPNRAWFISQAIQGGDHSMVASYIPFAWATLRRWQQTQESGGTLVTSREFELIENGLITFKAQLDEHRRQISRETSAHNDNQERFDAITALSIESRRLNDPLQRLQTLRYRTLTLADVYGNLESSPNLEAGLKRWMAQAENNAQVQIAMIPQQFDDDSLMASILANSNSSFDIDSIG